MFKNIKVTIPSAGTKTKELKRYIALDRIQEGLTMVLRNVYFQFNSTKLRSTSFDELRRVKQILEENPNYRIEIAGHTDNIGPESVNLLFSENRAKAVVNYLIKQGIGPGRLVAKGYGETRPLASNDDEKDGRELNRRVEFKVLNIEK
jgi:outer membrane protein OmpA-like peptidoglycan-associated protein